MNRFNLYLTILALLAAVDTLNYISEDYKDFLKLIFYITSLGLLSKMMMENFDFKIQNIKTTIEKFEGHIFFIITLFMVAFVLSSIISSILQLIHLKINNNILFTFFGILGALLGKIIKKRDEKVK